jgi:serine/threonine-protein kinase HipA
MNGSVFASGLLPEGQHRQVIAAVLGVAVTDTYALLKRFGRDVAGALVIAVGEPEERPGSVAPYTPESLEDEVAELPNRPLGIHDDSELSIAGLQDKLLLVDLGNGGWGRPVHGRPSTHILKLDDRMHPGLVEAEAACLALAREIGLTTVESRIETIAGIPCLITSRFDRRVEADGTVSRVHQEDVCQALARDPDAARGRGKYEDAGGPALAEVAGLLDRYAANPRRELDKLVAAVTFTVVIGNADGHGKNLAVLHPSAEAIELAPLYDTVPTALWSRLRSNGAMSVNGRWPLASITVDDIAAEARRWRHDPVHARGVALEVAEHLRDAVGVLDPESRVAELVTTRAERLLAGVAARP